MSLGPFPRTPALVVGSVHHTRWRPLRNSFHHRHYQWLIDLADAPQVPGWLRPVATFRGEDHLDGDPGLDALQDNVIRLVLAERPGLTIDRVLMLAHARVLGHTFDPMTVFWCLDEFAQVVATVIEVHNTYGGRHAYVIDGPTSHADLDKQFYVSPFNEVEGGYAVSVKVSPAALSVGIRLAVDGKPLLTATVGGRVLPATPWNVLRTVATHPLMTQRVSALIRWHGVRLWLRRLPVIPRPATPPAKTLTARSTSRSVR
ncbi:DUF1365 domain-containing protein [Metallococcus carri]|uniref:DUF1365 domain-containing protein n=1 Tax=Metallococcus carri TaxID=1656884 RepID=UPI002E287E0E|nr:DUF1365 domain-containing protein [Metallococcus carri]